MNYWSIELYVYVVCVCVCYKDSPQAELIQFNLNDSTFAWLI